MCRLQSHQQMDMIRNAAVDVRMRARPFHRTTEIAVKFTLKFAIEPRFTIFRAEDDVVVQ